MISSVRLRLQPGGHGLPANHKVGYHNRLFRVDGDNAAQSGNLVTDHRHCLINGSAGQTIGLIGPERVPGQDDSLVGLFISHGQSFDHVGACRQ